MNWIDYFSLSQNWNLFPSVVLLIMLGLYIVWYKPSVRESLAVIFAAFLYFLMTASPIASLLDFGLHSVAMLQHVVILMLIPLIIWPALTLTPGKKEKPNTPKLKKQLVLFSWLSGTMTMWLAHFMSAAKIASKSGLRICGIQAAADSWVLKIPDQLIWISLLLAGIIFLTPVFSRSRSWRLSPPASVIYLFTACVSCSILGLWVAFSASSAPNTHIAPLLTILRNPLPMTARADQELAGMIMWVPGCVLYVATSVHIALNWLGSEKKNLKPVESAFDNKEFKK